MDAQDRQGAIVSWHRRRWSLLIGRERELQRRISRALPDAIDLLVLTVWAGLTPRDAISHLADHGPPVTRPGFAAVVARLRRGARFVDALHELPRALGPAATSVAVSIAAAERAGTSLGPTLERLSIEARAERRRLADADARRLPVRLSFPLVGCTLPAFVLLGIAPAILAALTSIGGMTPP